MVEAIAVEFDCGTLMMPRLGTHREKLSACGDEKPAELGLQFNPAKSELAALEATSEEVPF